MILVLMGLMLSIACSTVGDNRPRTSLTITVQHHDRVISGIDVHVKFFATEFPGYDNWEQFDAIQRSDNQGQVRFADFPLGNHWFIGIGYDELIREQVIGNIDLRFDLANLSQDVVMYVSEEH
ncbi:MAG: hypothetical protein OEQ53_18810 [Saprospiraceae bacterium]|nr:hypothetical protein [Saprospiraceae bacterium]